MPTCLTRNLTVTNVSHCASHPRFRAEFVWSPTIAFGVQRTSLYSDSRSAQCNVVQRPSLCRFARARVRRDARRLRADFLSFLQVVSCLFRMSFPSFVFLFFFWSFLFSFSVSRCICPPHVPQNIFLLLFPSCLRSPFPPDLFLLSLSQFFVSLLLTLISLFTSMSLYRTAVAGSTATQHEPCIAIVQGQGSAATLMPRRSTKHSDKTKNTNNVPLKEETRKKTLAPHLTCQASFTSCLVFHFERAVLPILSISISRLLSSPSFFFSFSSTLLFHSPLLFSSLLFFSPLLYFTFSLVILRPCGVCRRSGCKPVHLHSYKILSRFP